MRESFAKSGHGQPSEAGSITPRVGGPGGPASAGEPLTNRARAAIVRTKSSLFMSSSSSPRAGRRRAPFAWPSHRHGSFFRGNTSKASVNPASRGAGFRSWYPAHRGQYVYASTAGPTSSLTLRTCSAEAMTPWDRLLDRVEGSSEQDRRRWLLVGVPPLIAIALLILSPWAIWPIATAILWIVAIGAVVVRLALRGRCFIYIRP